MKARFFATPAALRAWFERHHAAETELIVGYYRKDSGRASITWPESVDEALCVGWIDGIRRRIDAVSYSVRFTPRKASSMWSAVNIARVQALAVEGRMRPAGHAAFARRRDDGTGGYSIANRPVDLPPKYARRFRKDRAAWAFYSSQPPGYRKACVAWITSAKREETRRRRLAAVMHHSARGERLPRTVPARRKD